MYVAAGVEPETVSFPPTVKLAVPAVLSVPVFADGAVVKAMLLPLAETVPEVVVIRNVRLDWPVTEKPSALGVDPDTMVTSPVVVAVPAAATTTVPPPPVVNFPKLRAAPELCFSLMGAMTVAVAVPLDVEVLPGAAQAGVANRTNASEQIVRFFMRPPWLIRLLFRSPPLGLLVKETG